MSDLPSFEQPLDKVLDINSFQFWREPVKVLVNVREQMAEGGVIAIAHQPRKRGVTDADAEETAKNVTAKLEEAGFKNITLKKRVMKPVSTVCVLGVNA